MKELQCVFLAMQILPYYGYFIFVLSSSLALFSGSHFLKIQLDFLCLPIQLAEVSSFLRDGTSCVESLSNYIRAKLNGNVQL
jgi:hypothetical protein